jgi:inosose dehydratase
MSIRFGVSPIAWANDDMPELGGDTPLEDILRDIQELGFEGVELGGKFPRDAATLKPLLGRFGLDLIGGWYSGALLEREAEAEIAALQEHLALLKAMGSSVFVFAETSNAVHGDRAVSLAGTPRVSDGDWAWLGSRMTAVADSIQAQGLKFAYHHHLGTNTWAAGATSATDDDAKLVEWELVLPDAASVADAAASVERSGGWVTREPNGTVLIRDPWGTAVRLIAG